MQDLFFGGKQEGDSTVQDEINQYFTMIPKTIIEEVGVCKCGSDKWHRDYKMTESKVIFKCWDCKKPRAISKAHYIGFTIKDY